MTHTLDLLDPATRPRAPKIEGATHAHRLHGRRLALFHEMHLRQMRHARAIMEKVAAGEAQLAALEGALSDLDMRHNYRVFGTICGQECRMLTGHHTIEDRYLFPAIAAQADDGLRKVVDRLIAEHGVIHAYIGTMEEAADAAMRSPGPESFAALRAAFETLERYVVSHFGYEQDELEEALGYYDIEL